MIDSRFAFILDIDTEEAGLYKGDIELDSGS